jgi:hypothetical protein
MWNTCGNLQTGLDHDTDRFNRPIVIRGRRNGGGEPVTKPGEYLTEFPHL